MKPLNPQEAFAEHDGCFGQYMSYYFSSDVETKGEKCCNMQVLLTSGLWTRWDRTEECVTSVRLAAFPARCAAPHYHYYYLINVGQKM